MAISVDLKEAPLDDAASTKAAEHIGAKMQETRRGLSPRHVQLMTIAGGIGVGLFVGVGGVLSRAGPLPLIIGYFIYGLGFIWPTSLNVAEMVAWLPIRGSIYELAARFVDPALGFAMGWTYFYAGAMLVCTEYSAVATVIQFWNTDMNPAVWIAVCIVICYFLNMVAVKWYGEAEFVMGSTKILLLLGLMLATFITMVGGNPHHDAYGFRNWGGGNLAHPYYTEGATGYFLSICISVRYAVFTLGGPDIISLAAGEIRNPRRTIPKVAKLIVARILFFYIVGVLAVGILCNSRDPRLLGAIESGEAGAAASPWVLGLINLDIKGFLPSLINALILLSGLSCGNAFLYSSSRTLYSLAQDGQAPKIFLKCTKVGVPWVCVTAVTIISLMSFLVASNSASEVFSWFLDLTTVALVVNFTAMSWVFIGWSRALKAQGIVRQGVNTLNGKSWIPFLKGNSEVQPADGIIFPYTARGASWSPYLCLVLGSVISIFIGFDVFNPWSLKGFVTSYFGLAWFLFMFVLWKVVKGTKFVDPTTVDIYADGRKQAVDEECRHWEEGLGDEVDREALRERNILVRAWSRFWGN
ncbi:amino acid permease-domain-containing protein [Dactylonectria macrodidyma]|uniref:Amino acid permease-domain-containing protein n=1 Tax=Dactylonectria macrodidyma TaxID=307937 RepID=A0A9P9JAS2_9HYPO|nr:amino acid permease-domain-containing protein [Dactylonectria macrodidyma]